jgi:hypothetical protein
VIAKELALISRGAGVRLLFAVTALVVIIGLLLPRIPQPQSYHVFADQRSYLGIPNFGNVVSNLPFAAAGLWGLVFLLRSNRETGPKPFLDIRERLPYVIVSVGLMLTAFGSSYYHLQPSNARLVWDRLPMTIVFMSLVSAIIAERIDLRAGLWLLPVLLLVGIGSVLQWHLSELRGEGDLRFYSAVQAYAVLFLLIALLLPPRYTRGIDLAIVAGFYVLAKVLEVLDRPIFEQGQFVSGHTLKHLAAAGAGYWIFRMLRGRSPLGGRQTTSGRPG